MDHYDVVVVGAGFTGLTAAYDIARSGFRVLVVDADTSPGGLAGTFQFADGIELEKYYHHWFRSDTYATELVEVLGLSSLIVEKDTITSLYYNDQSWRLSSPLDVLKFKPLALVDRLRLGILILKVRKVRNWLSLEKFTIREWLEPLVGKDVYDVVWDPLIRAKFSTYSESVGAVWMWKKLALRGGSRGSRGQETLLYLRGGFGQIANELVNQIHRLGGRVLLGVTALSVSYEEGKVGRLRTSASDFLGSVYLFTSSPEETRSIFAESGEHEWLSKLETIPYLGNICLVLRLRERLSETYWLNVNDPSFPFVGVIEHTNLESSAGYGGTHVVYLSRYVSREDPLWASTDSEYFEYALKHLQRMFPALDTTWVMEYAIWRAKSAQPVVTTNYSEKMPEHRTPFDNVLLYNMAQIYPEDRGTNYAIRDGHEAANRVSRILANPGTRAIE